MGFTLRNDDKGEVRQASSAFCTGPFYLRLRSKPLSSEGCSSFASTCISHYHEQSAATAVPACQSTCQRCAAGLRIHTAGVEAGRRKKQKLGGQKATRHTWTLAVRSSPSTSPGQHRLKPHFCALPQALLLPATKLEGSRQQNKSVLSKQILRCRQRRDGVVLPGYNLQPC